MTNFALISTLLFLFYNKALGKCLYNLRLCYGKGCNTRYHLSCLDPPLPNAPPGIWLCISCIKKKIEFGVYSVSVGMDAVWNFKEGEENQQLLYLS